MKKKKIYFFIGTTAELIKIAPVIRELQQRKVPFKLITTGQNQIVFDDMIGYLGKIRPDISFEEKNKRSSMISFAKWTIKTFFTCLFRLRNEFGRVDKKNTYLIVHGDTISSVLGALTAKIYGLRLVHVESGLRSFNFLEPFPEEISRSIISLLSDISFCPNNWAVSNLKDKKGVKIDTKQNTLYESYKFAIKKGNNPKVINKLKKKYFLLVVHRQEHVFFKKDVTKHMFETIMKHKDKNMQCVLIMHTLTQSFFNSSNPRLFAAIKKQSIIVPRLPFPEFIKLIAKSEFIITDGGSNQEESFYMGKPCLLLRNVTERIEGLDRNVLLSHRNKEEIIRFLKNYSKYSRKKLETTVRPAKTIIDYLMKS